jgi:hypothetical protein
MRVLIEYIHTLLVEKQRAKHGFSFKKLDELKTLQEKFYYLRDHLEYISQGSSRFVFVLSSKKVIKLARNMAGVAQNKTEFDVYNTGPKSIITKIFQHDPKFYWIVSELVRPFGKSGEFDKNIGTTISVINHFAKMKMKTIEDLDEIIKFELNAFNAQKAKAEKDPSFQKDDHFALDLEINDNKKLLKNIPAKEMIVAMSLSNFDTSDLGSDSQFGKTADGRIVVLDYGINDEVWNKYYMDGPYEFDDATQKLNPHS